jgi:hypothetical protein
MSSGSPNANDLNATPLNPEAAEFVPAWRERPTRLVPGMIRVQMIAVAVPVRIHRFNTVVFPTDMIVTPAPNAMTRLDFSLRLAQILERNLRLAQILERNLAVPQEEDNNEPVEISDTRDLAVTQATGDGDTCLICCENVPDCKFDDCNPGHGPKGFLCAVCADRVLKRRMNCPLCRGNITKFTAVPI